MSPSNKLKALHTRRKLAQERAGALRLDLGLAERELAEVSAEIDKLTGQGVTVSEHALLRYCERVYGIDMAAVRASLLTPGLVRAVGMLGDGKYPIDGGLVLGVRNRVVTTLWVSGVRDDT
jgi:hypothetical protein